MYKGIQIISIFRARNLKNSKNCMYKGNSEYFNIRGPKILKPKNCMYKGVQTKNCAAGGKK